MGNRQSLISLMGLVIFGLFSISCAPTGVVEQPPGEAVETIVVQTEEPAPPLEPTEEPQEQGPEPQPPDIRIVGERPPPDVEGFFYDLIQETAIIELDLIARESLYGLRSEDGQTYELIGATTVGPIDQSDVPGPIMAILYVAKTEGGRETPVFPPDLYRVVIVDGAPESLQFVLVGTGGQIYDGEDVFPQSPVELGVDQGQNQFLFTEGSHRCVACVSWLDFCVCWKCRG